VTWGNSDTQGYGTPVISVGSPDPPHVRRQGRMSERGRTRSSASCRQCLARPSVRLLGRASPTTATTSALCRPASERSRPPALRGPPAGRRRGLRLSHASDSRAAQGGADLVGVVAPKARSSSGAGLERAMPTLTAGKRGRPRHGLPRLDDLDATAQLVPEGLRIRQRPLLVGREPIGSETTLREFC
jgi:hypothetical protein